MKFIKKNIKLIIGILIGILLVSGISVYATYKYFATDVSYTKDGIKINVEKALNELYTNKKETTEETKEITVNGEQTLDKYYKNLNVNITNQFKGMKIIASGIARTTNSSSPNTSITLNIPSTLDDNNAILITTRASYWWDQKFPIITGHFETITKLYQIANGYNSGDSTIQAGTALEIYFVNNLKPGGLINVKGDLDNNPQMQAVLLQVQK